MSRYIDEDDALEFLNLMYDNQEDEDDSYNVGVMGAINYIKHKAPTIEIDLADDGTLSVEVEDATRVARVLVEDGKNGDLYYADESEEYEWCHDCKEYDTERHCCPRWNKVIRQTLAELEADRSERWIPCSERLPEIGQKVLASTKKTVFTQVFKGYYSEPKRWAWENNSVKTIEAWQPLPKAWKGADDDL